MRRVRWIVVPCIALAAINGSASAQSDAVEEIVITTTLRPAAVSELAGNIASVDNIGFIAADHPSEALNRLPGVNIQHASGQEHLTAIRSPVFTGGAGAGSFLYLEDGIPLRSPGFANINGLFEAHTEQAGRIEVVRGPGSALYGSNAVHGMINVLTIAPGDLEISRIGLEYGSHDQASAKLTTYFPGEIGDGIFQLTLKHDDGHRASNGYDQQKATIRSDWGDGTDKFTFVAAFNNLNQETAPQIEGAVDAYKDEDLARSNPSPEAFRDATAIRSYLRWDHQVSEDLTLTLTPYFRKSEMNFLMHFLPGQPLEENSHKSFGVQSRVYKERSDSGLIIAGIDLEYTEGSLSEVQDVPTLPLAASLQAPIMTTRSKPGLFRPTFIPNGNLAMQRG